MLKDLVLYTYNIETYKILKIQCIYADEFF